VVHVGEETTSEACYRIRPECSQMGNRDLARSAERRTRSTQISPGLTLSHLARATAAPQDPDSTLKALVAAF
jgi:hypothetical protein